MLYYILESAVAKGFIPKNLLTDFYAVAIENHYTTADNSDDLQLFEEFAER